MNNGLVFCLAALMALLLFGTGNSLVAYAQSPDAQTEALTPEQEYRMNVLFKELRCVVCEGQPLSESNAEVAIVIREAVKTLITDGVSNSDIKQLLVQRYGDTVLATPPFTPHTWLLWLGPVIIFLVGLAIIFSYLGAARLHTDKPTS